MSLKPIMISQDAVVDQVKELLSQQKVLETQLEQLEIKLRHIEASISENEEMKLKNSQLQEQCLALFEEEWKRRAVYFPDIRLGVLNSAAALVSPQKK